MNLQQFLSDNRDAFIRREVVAVVFENEKVEGGDQAIGVVAGDQVNLMLFEGARNQAEIHDARRFCEAQAVGCDQAFVSIGSFHEFVTESGPPLWRVGSGLGDRAQMKFARVYAANHDRESVVEPKRWTECEAEAALIPLFDSPIDFLLVAAGRLFEDGGEGRAGVLRIEVDPTGQDCLVTYESARQIETALHFEMSTPFDDLREHLAQNQLLGEILAADDNATRTTTAAKDRQEEQKYQQVAGDLFRADFR